MSDSSEVGGAKKYWAAAWAAAYILLMLAAIAYSTLSGKINTKYMVTAAGSIIGMAIGPIGLIALVWGIVVTIRKKPFPLVGVLVASTMLAALNVVYSAKDYYQNLDARIFYAELRDNNGNFDRALASSQTQTANLFRSMKSSSDEANHKVEVILLDMQVERFSHLTSLLTTSADPAAIKEGREFIAQQIGASREWMPRIEAVYKEQRTKVYDVASGMQGTEVREIIQGAEERIEFTLDFYRTKIANYTTMLGEIDANLALIESPDNNFHLVSDMPNFKNAEAASAFNAHIAKIQQIALADEQLDKKFAEYQASLNRSLAALLK